MKESITITDNRSGESIEIPIEDGGVDSGPWTKFLPGIWFKDEGFAATAVTNSSITYIDGGAGQLEYRGYSIEDLASKSNFTEVAYLLVHGELPSGEQLSTWNSQLTEHAALDPQQNSSLLKSFNEHSHPMGMFTAGLAAMSTLYPDARDVEDPQIRQKHILNAIAKVSSLAASAAAFRNGHSASSPQENLSYIENFLSMTFSTQDKPFEQKFLKKMVENSIEVEIQKSPMFIFEREKFTQMAKGKKVYRMASFYQKARRDLNILMDENDQPIGGKWSFDEENRKKIPKNTLIPSLPNFKNSKHSEDVIKVINKNFQDHPGELTN